MPPERLSPAATSPATVGAAGGRGRGHHVQRRCSGTMRSSNKWKKRRHSLTTSFVESSSALIRARRRPFPHWLFLLHLDVSHFPGATLVEIMGTFTAATHPGRDSWPTPHPSPSRVQAGKQ
uniref:Uncharacterized protein n=1 Tax=Triticum urartu TaxID=4572 RepID=A0A8R7NYJ2_TRIUA